MIEGIEKGHGVPRARAMCDSCAREEVFTCDYEHVGRGWRVNEGQAIQRAKGKGWAHVKGKLLCPNCEAKRRAIWAKRKGSMEKTTPAPVPAAPEAPRDLDRAKRREIHDYLTICYDTEAGRYRGVDTDDSVAEALKVLPAQVASVRLEWFGDSGENEDTSAFDSAADALRGRLHALTEELSEGLKSVAKVQEDLEKIAGQWARVKKSLSPRHGVK